MNGEPSAKKRSLPSELPNTEFINSGVFRMDFFWAGPPPRAGQFFMLKPARSSVFLGRPLSVAAWSAGKNGGVLRFLAALRGRGTAELAAMRAGEKAELGGPLGKSWAEFLPPLEGGAAALVAGGVGAAPLAAFAAELPGGTYDFYAGFRTAPKNAGELAAFLGAALEGGRRVLVAGDNGPAEHRGPVTAFFDPAGYRAVFVCGPEAMMKAAAAKCRAAKVPCFVSVERRMACGVGACLGCTVETAHGVRRCCVDGPVFPAEDLFCESGS